MPGAMHSQLENEHFGSSLPQHVTPGLKHAKAAPEHSARSIIVAKTVVIDTGWPGIYDTITVVPDANDTATEYVLGSTSHPVG